MDTLYNDLLLELECPVCTEYMAPPIRQCKTGHNICARCINKLPKCPMCQQVFGDSRNMTLEALASKMQYPCTNRSAGCQARLLLAEKDGHEKICPFRKYCCPMNGCDFKGNMQELRKHWESKKITKKPYGPRNVCHIKLKSDSYFVNMVDAYDETFWFKSKTEDGKIYWALQYIGEEVNASDFYYEIEIFRQGMPKCSVTFSDYCQAIGMDNFELFKPKGCIFTQVDTLSNYVGGDQLLIYYFRVFKTNKTDDDEDDDNTEEMVKRKQDKKKFYKNRDKSSGANFKKHPDNQKKSAKQQK